MNEFNDFVGFENNKSFIRKSFIDKIDLTIQA